MMTFMHFWVGISGGLSIRGFSHVYNCVLIYLVIAQFHMDVHWWSMMSSSLKLIGCLAAIMGQQWVFMWADNAHWISWSLTCLLVSALCMLYLHALVDNTN